jgi:hypothetical protein
MGCVMYSIHIGHKNLRGLIKPRLNWFNGWAGSVNASTFICKKLICHAGTERCK